MRLHNVELRSITKKGFGTEVNLEKALYWYKNAAAQGLSKSQEEAARLEKQIVAHQQELVKQREVEELKKNEIKIKKMEQELKERELQKKLEQQKIEQMEQKLKRDELQKKLDQNKRKEWEEVQEQNRKNQQIMQKGIQERREQAFKQAEQQFKEMELNKKFQQLRLGRLMDIAGNWNWKNNLNFFQTGMVFVRQDKEGFSYDAMINNQKIGEGRINVLGGNLLERIDEKRFIFQGRVEVVFGGRREIKWSNNTTWY